MLSQPFHGFCLPSDGLVDMGIVVFGVLVDGLDVIYHELKEVVEAAESFADGQVRPGVLSLLGSSCN